MENRRALGGDLRKLRSLCVGISLHPSNLLSEDFKSISERYPFNLPSCSCHSDLRLIR